MDKDFPSEIEEELNSLQEIPKPLAFTSLFDELKEEIKFRPLDDDESSMREFLWEAQKVFKVDQESSKVPDHKKEEKKESASELIKKKGKRLEKPLQSSVLKSIMRKANFEKKNNNTVRFLVDLIVEHLPKLKDQYPMEEAQNLVRLCQKLRNWHLEDKKHVYNFEHLEMFFGQGQTLFCPRRSRQLFNFVIRTETLNNIKRPRSQIKDKVHYLRVAKLFGLRCKNGLLSLRNQCR